jgi:hypothetical protein
VTAGVLRRDEPQNQAQLGAGSCVVAERPGLVPPEAERAAR